MSSLRREVTAGVTTFLTMAYIAFVNPSILSNAGMPSGAVITATCLSAAIGCVLMGLLAKLPVGLAPGMGTNAYFAFVVCGQLGHSWQTALGAVFVSGVVFLILAVTGVRERIIQAIPDGLKHAIAAGIGIFIAFVGLRGAGLIADDPATLIALGDVRQATVIVAAAGTVLTATLLARGVRGGLLYGILVSAALAVILGVSELPSSVVSWPPSVAETFLAMDLSGALTLGFAHLVFAFVFVDLFDTIATLVAVAHQGGLMRKGADGRLFLPNATRALSADALATCAGATLGTSTVTSYVESTAGIAEGGRTGTTAIVVGIGFVVMLFFSPVLGMVPACATAPALFLVSVFMLRGLREIDWKDFTEAAPAVAACLGIPFTFSISNGLAFGFILYPLLKLLSGRAKEASPLVYGLGTLFLIKFVLLAE